MFRIRREVLVGFLFVLMIGSITNPVQTFAQSTPEIVSAPAFLLEPADQSGPYFDVEQAAGESAQLVVTLGNAGDTPITARTFAADVYTLTNGGFGINSDTESATGTTTWLDYASETLDLAVDQTVERTFTVSVPEGTPPGQYITGLVLQTADPITVGESGMLQQVIATAVAVFITVPGPVAAGLEIGEASLIQSSNANNLLVGIVNSGNVLLKPSGTVTVTTIDGQPVLTAPIAMGSVYAGMSSSIELPIPTLLAPGDYLVAVDLVDVATDARASEPSLALTVPAFKAMATPAVEPITIGEVVLDPVSDSTTESLQVVNVHVPLNNTGSPLPSARLTMHVLRDGQLIEDFSLNSSLVVPSGPTEIQQRYVPLTGWEPGIYSFSVTLEAVDPTSGQTTVMATAEASATIEVP